MVSPYGVSGEGRRQRSRSKASHRKDALAENRGNFRDDVARERSRSEGKLSFDREQRAANCEKMASGRVKVGFFFLFGKRERNSL